MTRVTILGCGTLGEALVGGLVASGDFPRDAIVATARRAERAAEIHARHGVACLLDNAAAVRDADAVVLCVKPRNAGNVLRPLADDLAGKLLISACAGVACRSLADFAPQARLVRAMPNTPARIREGMTVLAPGPGAGDDELALAHRIFCAVGRVRVLAEQHMDVVTGLSGSGPAFAFVVLEALADGGVMMGLPRDAAFELAAQTVQGAARLMLETGAHPAALKDQVTTPAGCTIAGLLMLEDGGIRSTLARAIQEATRVAAGLAAPRDDA